MEILIGSKEEADLILDALREHHKYLNGYIETKQDAKDLRAVISRINDIYPSLPHRDETTILNNSLK